MESLAEGSMSTQQRDCILCTNTTSSASTVLELDAATLTFIISNPTIFNLSSDFLPMLHRVCARSHLGLDLTDGLVNTVESIHRRIGVCLNKIVSIIVYIMDH